MLCATSSCPQSFTRQPQSLCKACLESGSQRRYLPFAIQPNRQSLVHFGDFSWAQSACLFWNKKLSMIQIENLQSAHPWIDWNTANSVGMKFLCVIREKQIGTMLASQIRSQNWYCPSLSFANVVFRFGKFCFVTYRSVFCLNKECASLHSQLCTNVHLATCWLKQKNNLFTHSSTLVFFHPNVNSCLNYTASPSFNFIVGRGVRWKADSTIGCIISRLLLLDDCAMFGPGRMPPVLASKKTEVMFWIQKKRKCLWGDYENYLKKYNDLMGFYRKTERSHSEDAKNHFT